MKYLKCSSSFYIAIIITTGDSSVSLHVMQKDEKKNRIEACRIDSDRLPSF